MVDIRELEMQTSAGVLEEELGSEIPGEEDLEELIGARARDRPSPATRRLGSHRPITDRLLETNRQRALGDTSTWWQPPGS